MTDARQKYDDMLSLSPRALWLIIIIVGIVFFANSNSLSLSTCRDWSFSEDSAEEVETGYAQMTKTVSMSALALLGVCLLARRSEPSLRIDNLLSMLLLGYLAICAISIAWSVSTVLTFRRVALLAACCIAALGIVKQLSMRDIVMMALVVSTAYLAIGACAQVATGTFRPLAADFRFGGTMHPNAQGVNCALVCLSGIGMAALNSRGRRLCLMLAAIGLVFLVLTKSRMSLASLVVAGGFFLATEVSRRTKAALALSGMAAICGMLLIDQLANLDLQDEWMHCVSLGRHEEMESLTGRVPLWTELVPYIQERPILGYGYRAFWNREHTLAITEALSGWQAPHAHSAYVDTVLDIGIPAAVVFTLALLLATWQAAAAYRRTGDPGYRFAHALLVFSMCNSVLDSNFTIPNFVPLMAACAAFFVTMRAETTSNIPAIETDASGLTHARLAWRPAPQ